MLTCYIFLAAGSTCVKQNDYYSQCQPGTSVPTTTTSSGPGSTTSSPTGSAPTGLASIPASKLTQISNFGPNPNNVQMYVYKPAKVASKPALIVASHCTSCLPHASNIYWFSSDCCRLHGYCAAVLLRLQVRFSFGDVWLCCPFPLLGKSPLGIVLFMFSLSLRSFFVVNSLIRAPAGTCPPMRRSSMTVEETRLELPPLPVMQSPTGASMRTGSSPSAHPPAQ